MGLRSDPIWSAEGQCTRRQSDALKRWEHRCGTVTDWKATALVRLFGLTKIPMIAYLRPRVVRQDREHTEIVIPLSRRAKNHHGSMYMGALAVGGDLASGLQAMLAIKETGRKVSFVFKDATMSFLRRPDGDVHFTCGQGAAVRALIDRTVADGERHDLPIDVVATVPDKSGDQPVATMRFTLSVKAR